MARITPLTVKQRFTKAVKRGTGEAYIILQENPSLNFSSPIIKAALKNYAYHPQMEGSRAVYISKLIKLSAQRATIRLAILKALATERQDTWALVQLFDLATIFAEQGDQEARKAVYKRFYKKRIPHSDWCGYDCILQLDGLEGMKYIADTIGIVLTKNPTIIEDDSMIRHFQNEHPEIDVVEELKKASLSHPYIKTYLQAVSKNEKTRKENPSEVIRNYDRIRKIIRDEKRSYVRSWLARSLSKKELREFAKELLHEEDKVKRGKYLSIFSDIKFPFGYAPLLQWAKGRPGYRHRVVEWSVEALKFFSGDDIRQFAIKQLKQKISPWTYLPLLISNYKMGDARLLKAIAAQHKRVDSIYMLAIDFIKIYKANKTRECKLPLLAIYNKINNGVLRKDIVQILLENNVLPPGIRREIHYDSYEKTRALVSS